MILRGTQAKMETGVDLTPVIDMVFMMLIFFLVATTFHQTEREMKIALPVASATEPISTMLREIIINVAADGSIVVSQRPVSLQELGVLVRQAGAANPEQKVTVRGDRAVAYASIVSVLDICKGAGIQEPYLDTVLAHD